MKNNIDDIENSLDIIFDAIFSKHPLRIKKLRINSMDTIGIFDRKMDLKLREYPATMSQDEVDSLQKEASLLIFRIAHLFLIAELNTRDSNCIDAIICESFGEWILEAHAPFAPNTDELDRAMKYNRDYPLLFDENIRDFNLGFAKQIFGDRSEFLSQSLRDCLLSIEAEARGIYKTYVLPLLQSLKHSPQ